MKKFRRSLFRPIGLYVLLISFFAAAKSFSQIASPIELPPTIKMDERYVEYDRENVIYFDDERQLRYSHYLKDGLFYDSTGQLASYNREKIFVVGENAVTYFITQSDEMPYHHSTPVAGEPVIFAGTALIRNGVLISLSNSSGHYKPNQAAFFRYLVYLKSQGVDLSRTSIYYTPSKIRANAILIGKAPDFMKWSLRKLSCKRIFIF